VKDRSLRALLARTAIHISNNATWVFVIVVAMSVMSSFSSIYYLSGIDDDLGGMYEKDIKGQRYAQNAYATLLTIESTAKDIVLAEADEARAVSSDALRAQGASLRALVFKVTPTFDSSMYRTIIANTKADTAALTDIIQKAIGSDASRVATDGEARRLLAGIESASAALKGDLVKLNDIKRRSSLAWFGAIRVQLRISLIATIVIFAASIAVRVFLYRGQKRGAGKGGSASA
jgi:hypothetical protein